MTYTADQSIEGAGTVSAAAIQAWFEAVGKDYAPAYGPDGKYVAPPRNLGQAIVDECRRYPDHVLNWDMVAGQIVHETAGGQSRYFRERNNPGGIGAINSDPDLALKFPTVQAGIRAHVAHLLVYAVGDGPWSADDSRRDAVRRMGWLGVAKRWRDLNGKWAYPGTTYGQSIATLANRLLDFANHQTWEPPMDDRTAMQRLLDERYPLKVRVDYAPVTNPNIPNQPANAEGRRWETVHETANPTKGANAEMHRQFVHNGGGANPATGYEGVSFHWVVDDTEVIGLVDPTMKAWQASDGTNGTGNSSESTETCVNSDGDWAKTKENLARHLARRIVADPNRSPDRIAQHNQWARDKKNCPARLRANGGKEWNEVIARVRTILTDVGYFGGQPPKPYDPLSEIVADPFPGNPWGVFYVPRVFAEDATKQGLAATGHYISGAFIDDDGLLVQYTERCRQEWQPGGYVTRELLGLKALQARHPDRDPARKDQA